MSLLSELKNLIILIPFIYWLQKPAKWRGWMGYLGGYLLLSFFTELVAWSLRKSGIENGMVYQIFAPASFVIVHWLLIALNKYHVSDVIRRKWAISGAVLMVVLILLVTLFKIPIFYLILFSAFTFAVHSLIAIFRFSSRSDRPLLRSGEFWVGIAILFLSTVDTPSLVLATNWMITNPSLAKQLYSIHDFGFIIQFILFTGSIHFARSFK
jgi:hypothetical protein